MTEERHEATTSIWLAILQVFWDGRWSLLGIVVLMMGFHFAFEYADVLFPNRRAVTPLDALGIAFFGGLIVWSHASSAHKRIEKLEETVAELRRKAKQ